MDGKWFISFGYHVLYGLYCIGGSFFGKSYSGI